MLDFAPRDPDSLDIWAAALLGAVQGATEFLPVSSSGHLSLGQAWLGIDPTTVGHRFNIIVHAGTLLAVLWVYRKDVREMLGALFHLREDSPARRRVAAVFVGTLPLIIVLFPPVEALVIHVESHIRWIGAALLATAGFLFIGSRFSVARDVGEQPPSPGVAFVIGLGQLLAIIPGISRSGTTIALALLLGVGRREAARLSFLLSIPAITGAGTIEAMHALESPAPGVTVVPFVVGFVVSLGVGLLALLVLLRLVHRGRLILFVPYLLLVGGLALALG